MTTRTTASTGGWSRRGFLGLLGAGAAVPLLSSCAGGSGSPADTVRFWDMPWGPPAYSDLAERLVSGDLAGAGRTRADYQSVPWNNYYMTFASGIAAGTGPAASTGAAFMAFLFERQEAIHHADRLVERFREDGTYDDFLPGVLDTMRTPAGYVGIPWQLDMKVLWYNKRILEKAGADVPTDWDSLLRTGRRLRKAGHYGYGTCAGAGANHGAHLMVNMMINNGGGLFDDDGNPDCVTDRNIEAMDFVRELVHEKIIDPAALSYSTDNLVTQWKSGQVAMGIHDSGLALRVGSAGDQIDVASPLAGPHGDRAALYFVNNIMMYRDAGPSPQAVEDFVHAYVHRLRTYWDEGLITSVPVLRSIAESPKFAGDPRQARIVEEWQPVSRTYCATGRTLTATLAAVDGGNALVRFTQTMLQGDTPSRRVLSTLQQDIESISL